MTYSQGQALEATQAFSFKPERGKRVDIKKGDLLEVTNTRVNQKNTGIILLSRYGRGRIGQGWPFAASQVSQLFAEVD